MSLALVLAIVGVKMLTAEWIKEALGDAANFWLLGVIFAVLIGGGIASWMADRRGTGGPTAGGAINAS